MNKRQARHQTAVLNDLAQLRQDKKDLLREVKRLMAIIDKQHSEIRKLSATSLAPWIDDLSKVIEL